MNKLGKFLPLFSTNIFGVMNDNTLKALVGFVGASWVAPEYKTWVINATAGALVLPYLLFSPLAGKLPHFFKKTLIIRAAKICELPIMLIAILGFHFQNIALALSAVMLMGLQSALFSPSKYGLIRDIGGKDGISQGMGGIEAFSFLGILIGTFLGSLMSDSASPAVQYAVLLGFAALGIACSFTIRAEEQKVNEETSANPIVFIRDTAKMVRKHKGLKHIILLLSLFWWLSGSIQTLLMDYCPESLGMSNTQTGIVLGIMAIGISAGCVICGQLDHKRFMLGLVPMFGFLIGLLLIAIYITKMSNAVFTVSIVALAIMSGFFKIPMDAEIQKRAKPEELNIILAYFNLISFVFIFLAAATNILITSFLSAKYVFLIDGIIILASSVYFLFNYRSALCYFSISHIKLHYRISEKNREALDCSGNQNLLILPMHRALLDPIMLFSALYDKKMQPLVDEAFFKAPGIGHVLSLFDAVKVPDMRVSGRQGVTQAQKLDGIIDAQLHCGANILFYPSGHITMDGKETIGSRRLAHNAAKILPENTKVVGVRIWGFWGSKWSNYQRKRTPSIIKLLGISLLSIVTGYVFFKKKRDIEIEYVDITEKIKEWSKLPKMEFNKKLEDFYMDGRECETAIASTF